MLVMYKYSFNAFRLTYVKNILSWSVGILDFFNIRMATYAVVIVINYNYSNK